MQRRPRCSPAAASSGASIDEVAEDAGFTKGAFYANFKSKEELFLAMLDERFAERLRRSSARGDRRRAEEQARRAGADFAEYLRADPEWQRLFFEFAAYAARNERVPRELWSRATARCASAIADVYRAPRGRSASSRRSRSSRSR